MPRLGTFVTALSILIGLSASAQADAIQSYVATYTDSLGLNGSTPIDLPSLAQGGSVVLGTLPIVVQPTDSNPQVITPLNGTFQVDISIKPPAGLPPSGFENILVTGNLQGSVTANVGPPLAFSGGVTGSWLNVQFPTGNLYNVPDLSALAQHPERIHLVGQVIKDLSGKSVMQESLVIDPPEIVIPGTPPGSVPPSIPEPPSILTYLLALGGLALHRQRSTRTGRSR
jgi:hypothetical protein